MPRLTDADVTARLDGIAWERDGDTIVREVRCKDFEAAIGLVNRVAEIAESANHHPDILVHGYNHVRLTLSTHSEGGLTAADFALAGQLDALIG
ncbi:MAG TPA: 4a-hydroxytetrahydrobiopterin dehydratase [Conexibacter sp.]|jgi:4a-hydroxytetrahydrobiopterin dehydratase